jgi:hypothetical protein
MVPDVPAASVPTFMFATCDVVPPAAREIATETDLAVAAPRLLTVTFSPIGSPGFTVAAVDGDIQASDVAATLARTRDLDDARSWRWCCNGDV